MRGEPYNVGLVRGKPLQERSSANGSRGTCRASSTWRRRSARIRTNVITSSRTRSSRATGWHPDDGAGRRHPGAGEGLPHAAQRALHQCLKRRERSAVAAAGRADAGHGVPLLRGRRVELVLDLSDQPHCNRLVRPDLPARPSRIIRCAVGFCRDCTMVQIDHTIPKEIACSPTILTCPARQRPCPRISRDGRRIVAAYGLGPRDLVVDIGSNDGTWLKQYAPFGCRRAGRGSRRQCGETGAGRRRPHLGTLLQRGLREATSSPNSARPRSSRPPACSSTWRNCTAWCAASSGC